MSNIYKNCQVEVSSSDEGFVGAWYGAILLENPTKSGRKKLKVRYSTLVDEDGSSLLTELVQQTFIRPVPPNDSNEETHFEEGSVVDADHKDGWWTGVVIKKLEENQKFLVYFDYPPDLIQFERKQLRTHFDWIDSKWVKPKNKELSKSMFRCGTFVEVSSKINEVEAVWVPAMIVKEIDDGGQKKFLVKCFDKSLCFNDEMKPNITVDMCNVRPMPSPTLVEQYNLLDPVDVFHGSGWRQGLVRGIHSGNRYIVSFVVTKEESVFDHSDLRPSKEWEDGVWYQGPKNKFVKKTPSDGKRKMLVDSETTSSESNALCQPKKLKIIRSCNSVITFKRTTKRTNKSPSPASNVETAFESEAEPCENVAAMELPLIPVCGNQMDDDMLDITPQVLSSIARESSPVIDVTPVKETQEKESPEKTLRSQNGLRVESNGEKMSEEHNSNENGRKKQDSNFKETETLIIDTSDNTCEDDFNETLSSWKKSSTCSNKSKLSFDEMRNAINDLAAEEDTTMVLPFAKQSPIWKVFDSMDVFTRVKQSPHFSPLLETREEFREGSAVGEMVKFTSLMDRMKSLQLHTPKSTLERLKECFFELEKYGFDVKGPISRIEMLFSLKDKQVSTLEELKDHERKMTEEVNKKEKVEEDLKEVEVRIVELRNQEEDLKEKKEDLEKAIVEMQLCGVDLDKKIQEVEIEFQMTVEAPW